MPSQSDNENQDTHKRALHEHTKRLLIRRLRFHQKQRLGRNTTHRNTSLR